MSVLGRLSRNRKLLWPAAAIALALGATAWQLGRQGRAWWCACGGWAPWAGDIWSAHNSQHFVDPYSFTHLLHGVAFCGLLALLVPRYSPAWRLVLAVCTESFWELLENSPLVIHRYREATFALGYEGDAILNSLGDIACCAAGFMLARRLGFWKSAILFAAMEFILVFWIRDNLTLNILMLVHPVAAIKAWQMVH